jgi:hypothetical protein
MGPPPWRPCCSAGASIEIVPPFAAPPLRILHAESPLGPLAGASNGRRRHLSHSTSAGSRHRLPSVPATPVERRIERSLQGVYYGRRAAPVAARFQNAPAARPGRSYIVIFAAPPPRF